MSKLATLRESRDKAVAAYRSLLDAHDATLETRSLTDEELTSASEAEKRVAQFDAAIARAEADEAREAEIAEKRAQLGTPTVSVTSEPLIYGRANPDHSFYRDLLRSAVSGPGQRAAQDRLIRHQTEMETLANGPQSTKEARSARKAVNETRRQSVEQRDMSTGSGSLGDWVPPVYLLDDTAPYRDLGRSLIDQCHTLPLPATGMTINIPRVTAPTEAVNQTAGTGENTTVATQDMTGSYGSGAVQTIINNSNVSQQYLDRFGPAGFAADQLIFTDQKTQTNKLLDQYAWGAILAAAPTPVAYTDTSFEAQKYRQSIGSAKVALRKTPGVVTFPTHIFTTAELWETLEGAYDSANRPLVVPQGVAFNPLAVGESSNAPEGYTGFRFASAPAFVDENLWSVWSGGAAPAGDSTYHPTLVADLSIGVEWMEGEPNVRVLPQPGAATLTVLIQTYVYCALVVRYPGALQVVAGTGTTGSYLL